MVGSLGQAIFNITGPYRLSLEMSTVMVLSNNSSTNRKLDIRLVVEAPA